MLGKISSIEELNQEFKGITDIIEIWFSNYKGPGKMQSQGFAGEPEAIRRSRQFSIPKLCVQREPEMIFVVGIVFVGSGQFRFQAALHKSESGTQGGS